MKLVDEARSAWRWTSMQVLTLLALAPIVWTQLPPDVRAMVPQEWYPGVISLMALAGMVGRLRKQG